MDKETQMDKIEVEVTWETNLGTCKYLLKFTGQEIVCVLDNPICITLYQDYTGGYLVYEENQDADYATLHPKGAVDRQTGSTGHKERYSASEIAALYPYFSDAVGEIAIIDLD